MLDWLVSIQFADGAFPGGTIDQSPQVPVSFNTGQILMGLAAGSHLAPRYGDAMRRAADWLIAAQDADGCWRRFPSPFAVPGEKTYDTHAALGLMAAAEKAPDRGYLEAALRSVDWALTHQSANGWFAQCCLTDMERPLTHTLGYALRGVIGAYLSSRDAKYLHAACLTADGAMRALGRDGRLPGRLDREWRPAARWVCLTGSAQLAECWLLLHRETGREDYRKVGLAVSAFVRRTLPLDGPAGVRGGVNGSLPIDGGYGQWQYLSWAAKFMIDAAQQELQLQR
jgi:hypothetical protein